MNELMRNSSRFVMGMTAAKVAALIVAGIAILPSGCGGPKPIAALIEELKSGSAGVRHGALKELEKRGPEGREAIPFVAAVLQDSDRDNRYRAAKVLSKIGADSSAVSQLALALKDPDADVRYYVAKSLSVIGPDAEPAVPSLVEALQDRNNDKIYHYLLKSLRRIGPKALPAVSTLKEWSRNPDESLRKDALAALASIESE